MLMNWSNVFKEDDVGSSKFSTSNTESVVTSSVIMDESGISVTEEFCASLWLLASEFDNFVLLAGVGISFVWTT